MYEIVSNDLVNCAKDMQLRVKTTRKCRTLVPGTLFGTGKFAYTRGDDTRAFGRTAKGHGLHGSAGPALVDDPPSKLLLSSQVLQVANSNTVKDGFLFLFSDILVIAKPVTQDSDALLDTNKPLPLDRKFIVVQPRDVWFTADRDNLLLSSFASATICLGECRKRC